MRGPLVYCFEECDNGADLSALRIPRNAEILSEKKCVNSIGEIVTLKIEGIRVESDDALYSPTLPKNKKAALFAVPYYTWGNRETGGMRVWILED